MIRRLAVVPRFLMVLGTLLLAGSAVAQETMEFEAISPESARAIERARRAGRTAPMPPVPPAPSRRSGQPDEPLPPEPPERIGDIMRISRDIHIEEGEVVDGDVFALGGDVRVDGHVKGNVASTGGNVTLGSTARVDGDVMCIGGELTEEPGAVVRGQRVTGGHRMRGRIDEKIEEKIHEKIRDRAEHNSERTAGSLAWLLILMAAAWGATRLAPGRTSVAVDTMRHEAGMSFVVGLIVVLLLVPSLIAMALVVAILCITIIGIPIAIGVLFSYFILLALLGVWGLVIGLIPVGQAAARRFSWPTPDLGRAAMYGVLVVAGLGFVGAIIKFLPFFGGVGTLFRVIGILATCVLGLIGMGALLRSKVGQGPEGQWWPLVRRTPPLEPALATAGSGVVPASAVPPPPPPPPPPAPPSAFQPPPAPEPPPPTG